MQVAISQAPLGSAVNCRIWNLKNKRSTPRRGSEMAAQGNALGTGPQSRTSPERAL